MAAQQLADTRRAALRPRPYVASNRTLLGIFCSFILCAGLAFAFWLPSRSLVHDLRSSGSNAAAVVIAIDNKPKYVKIRFLTGTASGTEVKLSDYAGMYPDVANGDSMLVTYKPNDPSRVLSKSWVSAPPANLPAYGMSAGAGFFLVGTIVAVLRRRWVLRNWPSDPAATDSAGPERPGPPDKTVSLTKP
ncbi:hypothetical protein [Streptomyces sp. AC627_RSS907]|uniref:hypothetical protein n=1 Tax=Streptomyces sp. AC627_RSS907 TaxID=2823684 RepID=UPI001C227B8B|nr:hypothetical protein [Streptomyces sp. AC627_RSS907]